MRRFRHAIFRRAISLLRKRQTWAPGAVLEAEAVAVAREAELDLGAARPEERGAAQAFPHCVPDLTSHLPARPAMSATAY